MRRLEVRFVNESCAHVSGYGARNLLTQLRGRSPVWSTLSRAWVCQPATARDLVAVAEARGYLVNVSGQTVAAIQSWQPEAEPAPPGDRELW